MFSNNYTLTAVLISCLQILIAVVGRSETTSSESTSTQVYDFTAEDIQTGTDTDFNKYKGKVLLIVNVASDCGFTKQNYKELIQLQRQYDRRKFAILAFPCNQFGEQEPRENFNIWKDINEKYRVNFDFFRKVYTTGNRAHPLFTWLRSRADEHEPTWNFSKYLLDREGNVVRFASGWVYPMALKDDIDTLLTGKKLTGGLLDHENIVHENHKHTDL